MPFGHISMAFFQHAAQMAPLAQGEEGSRCAKRDLCSP